jgi:hypothetical protein
MYFLQVDHHGSAGHVNQLAKPHVPVRADFPEILTAARRDVFDVQRIGVPDPWRVFTV